jgi:hypothetical protein
MGREGSLRVAVSFAAILFGSIAATAATSNAVTFYFDDQDRFEREIAPGEVHPYVITLRAGQFVRFVAGQDGLDVALTFESPSGTRLSRINQGDTTDEPETLSAIAETNGRYRLLVSSDWSKTCGCSCGP